MDLEDHFAEIDPTPDVREAYRTLANAQLPNGVDVWKGGHGYIKCELCFGTESDNVSFYRAVLKKSWVLWYFRKPALTRKLFDPDKTLRRFEGAKDRGDGEITLPLHNATDALEVIEWIRNAS